MTARRRIPELARPDGAGIAVRVDGDGPDVVLGHGAGTDSSSWAPLVALLARRHRVWRYDRRGHGRSRDGSAWSLGREAEDLLAVLDILDGPAHVVGHSFGALCCLVALPDALTAPSWVLYEPPLRLTRIPTHVTAAACARIETGDIDNGLVMFLLDIAGVGPDELHALQSSEEVWHRICSNAATLPREITAATALDSQVLLAQASGHWITFVRGETTTSRAYPDPSDIHGLPGVRLHTLTGQGHLAAAFAPEQLAEALAQHLAAGPQA